MTVLRVPTTLGLLVVAACATPSPPSQKPMPQPLAPTDSTASPSEREGASQEARTPDSPTAAENAAPADRPFAHLPAPPGAAQQRPMPVSEASDPYGDPKGWADVPKRGDPWATRVMKALNAGEFPTAPDPSVTIRFTLHVCKDGSVKPTLLNTSGSAAFDDEVRAQLRATPVPPPPPEVQAKMKGECAKLRYGFVWLNERIR